METQINLDGLPSLPFGDCKKLPNCSAVYIVLGSNDQCIYVGSTWSLTRRFIHHDKRELFAACEATRIVWIEADGKQLIPTERHYIQGLQPLLNRKMPTDRGTTKVGMVGGSLVIRIPKHIVREMQLEKGEEVTIETAEIGRGFYVEPVKPQVKGKK